MDIVLILIVSVGLSLDIFACSIAICMAMGGVTKAQAVRMAGSFSLFHVLMAALGFALGMGVLEVINNLDHWIAFALLMLVGIHMIYNSLTEGEAHYENIDHTKGKELYFLSLATSLDALALGMSFAALHYSIILPLISIGLVVFAFGILGTQIGPKVGKRIGRHSETFGGLILILLGVRVVLEPTLA